MAAILLLLFGGASPVPSSASSEKTVVNNLVVTVTLAEGADFDSQFHTRLKNTLEDGDLSVRRYVDTVSGGKAQLNNVFVDGSVFIPDSIYSYMPAYEYSEVFDGYLGITYNGGYDNRFYAEDGTVVAPDESGAKQHIARFLREQTLIKSVANAVEEIGVTIDDGNGDGRLDNLTVVVMTDGKTLGWDDILWSHVDYTYTYHYETLSSRYYIPEDFNSADYADVFTAASIDGLRVRSYTILPSTPLEEVTLVDKEGREHLNVGEACHEILHVFGAVDYYPYDTLTPPESNPVGEFDIMSSHTYVPQLPTVYARSKLGWTADNEIQPITKSGQYTVYPTSIRTGHNAYKLVLSDYDRTGEYFMIEARTNGATFDSSLPGTGIIVYRVNEKNGYLTKTGDTGTTYLGNTYGASEVFIFRLGDGDIYTSKYGGISYALLDGTKKAQMDGKYVDKSRIGTTDKSANKTFIDQNDDSLVGTSLYYSDGTNSGVMIDFVGLTEDNGILFTATFDDSLPGTDFDDQINYAVDLKPVVERYYDGKTLVARWAAGLHGGTVKIVGVKGEDVLKYKDGAYVPKGGSVAKKLAGGGYADKTVFTVTAPSDYAVATVPAVTDMTAVFIIYESADGKVSAQFCRTLSPSQPTFMEYLFGTTKWLVAIISIIALCLLAFVVGTVFIYKRSRRDGLDGENDGEDDGCDLTEELGEDYWMTDGYSPDGEEESPSLSSDGEESPDGGAGTEK